MEWCGGKVRDRGNVRPGPAFQQRENINSLLSLGPDWKYTWTNERGKCPDFFSSPLFFRCKYLSYWRMNGAGNKLWLCFFSLQQHESNFVLFHTLIWMLFEHPCTSYSTASIAWLQFSTNFIITLISGRFCNSGFVYSPLALDGDFPFMEWSRMCAGSNLQLISGQTLNVIHLHKEARKQVNRIDVLRSDDYIYKYIPIYYIRVLWTERKHYL